MKDPLSSRGTNLVDLYLHFVESFEAKLDQMALVQIVAEVAKQLYPSRPYVADGKVYHGPFFLRLAISS